MMRRRDFVSRIVVAASGMVVARALNAQQPTPPQGGSTPVNMDQGAARTVRKPPKRDAAKSMTDDQRDEFERGIRCQCGCTHDVYICRTTDFSCQVCPPMHRDVMSLVEGGYSAQEILDSFVGVYGESVLMAPKREGFNLAGYLVPFAALGIGTIALTVVLKSMQRRPVVVATGVTPTAPGVSASDDEMTKLAAAIRKDE